MNVLIVGLGSIAKKHINALKEINSDIIVYALRSSQNAAQYLDVKNIFSIEEAKQLSLNFCIICSPTFNHLEDLNKVISLGTPVIIEKPLSNKLNFDTLLEKIKKEKIKTYVACNLRFLDALNYVKTKFIDGNHNSINEVNSYCGSYLPEWRKDTDYKKSYSANEDMGGGVHLDLIHELDYLYWMFGAPVNSSKILMSKSSLNINAVDYANYNLTYDNFNANLTLNYFRKDSKRELEIVFEEYTIRVDLLKNEVYKNNELIFSSKQQAIDTYLGQLNYFIKNLNKECFNDANEANEVLKICLK